MYLRIMYCLIVSTYEVLVVLVFLDSNHLVGLIVRTSRLRNHVKFAFGSVTKDEDSIASVALVDVDAPCPTHYAHGRFGLAQVSASGKQACRYRTAPA